MRKSYYFIVLLVFSWAFNAVSSQNCPIEVRILPDGDTLNLCNGQSLVLETDPPYNQTSPPFLSYLWQDNSTDSDLWVNASGTYIVRAIDSTGCESSDTVYVNLLPALEVQLTIDNQLVTTGTIDRCEGDTVLLDGLTPGFQSYVWPDLTTDSDLYITQPGDYFVRAIDSLGCIDYSDTITVFFVALPSDFLANDTAQFCYRSQVTLDAGAGFLTYSWSNGAASQLTSVDSAGDYAVLVTDSIGCPGSDTILVEAIPADSFSIGPDRSICFGDSVTLSPDTNFVSVLWLPDSITAPTLTVGTSGVFYAEGMNADACWEVSNMVIVTLNSLPLIPTITKAGVVLSSSSAVLYQWYLNGDPIPGATDQTWTAKEDGSYTVEVFNSEGCSSISAPFDFILASTVHNAFSPNGDGVNEFFVIGSLDNYPNNQLEIFNRWGNKVFSAKGYDNTWDGTNPDGKKLPDGTYFYKLDLGDGSEPFSDFLMIQR